MTSETTSTVPDRQALRANLEDVLPLMPNQQALLLARELSDLDPGFLQVRYRLEGPLDVARYEAAWRTVIGRHQSLRSSIKRRDEGNPLLVVWRHVELPLTVDDWRDERNRDTRLAEALDADRKRGLDLDVAPSMRLRLIRTGDDIYEAIWTCHHLFVDGWSAAIVLEDVIEAYGGSQRPGGAEASPPAGALRSYVAWVSDQNPEVLGAYWQRMLAGYRGTPSLSLGRSETAAAIGEVTVDIGNDESQRIAAAAAELGVPVASLLQFGWALVVATLTGEDDVAFGTTVSGRHAGIAGMERLVGYFSNAVPIRLKIERPAELRGALAAFRDRQFEMAEYEHAPLSDIQRWSDVPGHRPMFDTFIAVENFPASDRSAGEVVQSNFRSGLTTAYPVTLAIATGEDWFLHLRFDGVRCSEAAARALLDQLRRVLTAAADHAAGTVGDVLDSAGDAVSEHVSGSVPWESRDISSGRSSRTDAERRLAAIWSRHLDLPEIGVDVDYFALGGTSIGAVRLFESIEEEFGANLPLSTLLMHPTIESLAAVISGVAAGDDVERTCLVPIQPHGSKAPIAAVHGGGGEVFIYRELAEHLGPDQPLYGLQPVGLDGVTRPLDRVPDMAARYVEELQSVQPDGPYRLIGFCFGGTVCLEMAAQLEENGHEVDFIGIIDGGLPLEEAQYESSLERARHLLRSRGVLGTIQAIGRRVRWRAGELWKTSIRRARGEQPTRHVPVAAANRRAFNSFTPRPASAPITLIRSAEQQPGEGKDWDFIWEGFTPRLETARVAAGHTTLFEGDQAKSLADIIRRSVGD